MRSAHTHKYIRLHFLNNFVCTYSFTCFFIYQNVHKMYSSIKNRLTLWFNELSLSVNAHSHICCVFALHHNSFFSWWTKKSKQVCMCANKMCESERKLRILNLARFIGSSFRLKKRTNKQTKKSISFAFVLSGSLKIVSFTIVRVCSLSGLIKWNVFFHWMR